jgi:lysyl-tRNA synthetase class 1
MAEKFFWADAIADQIIKQKGELDEYVCASGITPSGQVHIGNFREVITTDMVVRALRDKGKKVRFIYSWDDFDRFRKVPKGVANDYEKYLGMPISDIPSPFDESMSYAEFNEKTFEDSLKEVFIGPEFIYQNKMNKKCAYADLIKVALERKDNIKAILDKYRKEPLSEDWWPVMVYCDSCKKDLTRITGVDGYNLSYECECGHSETFDIREKGLVSIRWRIDWPLRWKYEGVNFEPGGIDHSVHGGSFTTAKEISRDVFEFEPPVYQFYEWIGIKGGEAFSSSTGNALSLNDVLEIYEPAVLRYLFVGTKPKSAFDISFDNDVISSYEKFDALEEKYFEGNCNPREKRMYEMSVVNVPEDKPDRTGFRGLIVFVQTGKIDGLNECDKVRAEKVSNWLSKYAGEDMRFSVKEKLEGDFSEEQKKGLVLLREVLREGDFSEKELFDKFYEICENAGLENTDFFDACYNAIIGKSKGPRLASLIKAIGEEKIIKILEGLE